MEIQDSENRRALNLIWNAARDYTFDPDFKVFDETGCAERYWNSIIGAVRRHYDYPQLMELFHSFQGMLDQNLYENLLWLGLENCTFLREEKERPALPALRKSYARRVVSMSRAKKTDRLLDVLEEAHFRRALGEDPQLEPRDRELLDALEYGADLTTEDIVARTKRLFREYLQYVPLEEAPVEEDEPRWKRTFLPNVSGHRKTAHVDLPAVRGFAFGFGEYRSVGGGTRTPGKSRLAFHLPALSAQTEEGLREYIQNYFGAPLYDSTQTQKLEGQLCTGNHRACHLHFTRGSYGDPKLAKGYAGFQKRAVLKQMEKNRRFYQEHLARNRNSIARLTSRIRNALMTQLELSVIRSSTGLLEGGRVWRATELNDEKVFRKQLRGDSGDLSVDILLDASTSQLYRQESISTQAYIIAESLTRCNIPTRVYSFCSMSGYTVVNLFRDYEETKKNDNVFHYFTTGCNRDGLAVRVAAHMLEQTNREHKMLIILSDVKPNDVVRVQTEAHTVRDYAEEVGVMDTASEVLRARMRGISVVCVFTGEDSDLPAARTVYGRDFSRIRSLNQFADTVGTLIQNQIRSF